MAIQLPELAGALVCRRITSILRCGYRTADNAEAVIHQVGPVSAVRRVITPLVIRRDVLNGDNRSGYSPLNRLLGASGSAVSGDELGKVRYSA